MNNPRKKRRELWRNDPHCYWCGKITVETSYDRREPPPHNQATLDHVFGNLDEKRRRIKKIGKNVPIVLACYECNQRRGLEAFLRFRDEIRQQGGTLGSYLENLPEDYQYEWREEYKEREDRIRTKEATDEKRREMEIARVESRKEAKRELRKLRKRRERDLLAKIFGT